MIRGIQLFIQILFIGLLLFGIIRAQNLPQPIKPYAISAQKWLVGEELTLNGFVNNWKAKGEVIEAYVPHLGKALTNLPSPSDITADSILQLLKSITLDQPAKKWETIKTQFSSPVSTDSGSKI